MLLDVASYTFDLIQLLICFLACVYLKFDFCDYCSFPLAKKDFSVWVFFVSEAHLPFDLSLEITKVVKGLMLGKKKRADLLIFLYHCITC